MRSFSTAAHRLVLIASLLSCGAAFAGDGALNVVGPTGASSISVSADAYGSRNDQMAAGTSTKLGESRYSNRTATVSGIYAINPQVSISAAVPWAVRSHDVLTWQGSSQASDNKGVGVKLGASAVLLDQHSTQDYRLLGNIGLNHTPGSNSSFSIGIQPQYWFATNLQGSVNLSAERHPGHAASQDITANLLWRITPEVSLVPSLRFTHVNGSDSYSAFWSRTAKLDATYHVDRDWSASAGVAWSTDTDQTTNVYAKDVANGHTRGVNVSVRHSL